MTPDDNNITVDDLFTAHTSQAATECATKSSTEDDDVFCTWDYKEWFDAHRSFYSLMMQITLSVPSSAAGEIPPLVYDQAARLYCAVTAKRRLACSRMHVTGDLQNGYIRVRFWVSYDDNVTAFLNFITIIYSFEKGIIAANAAEHRFSFYSIRVDAFSSEYGYEQSLSYSFSSSSTSYLDETFIENVARLKHDETWKCGDEKAVIREICRTLNGKYIFRVPARWTVTWQTLRYFWLRMLRQHKRELHADWYEETRNELWLDDENC